MAFFAFVLLIALLAVAVCARRTALLGAEPLDAYALALVAAA